MTHFKTGSKTGSKNEQDQAMMSLGDHLEELRGMIVRIVAALLVLTVLFFALKRPIFSLVFAPGSSDFVLYRAIEKLLALLGRDFHFVPYSVELISTDLSAQFMMHIKTSLGLAALVLCPYILYECFRFVSPALYDNERKYFRPVMVAVYLLFVLGVLMNYFVLFPVSFRFLGTYQVAESVTNQITVSSYISTFFSLTFVMSLVFQLPVLAFLLARLGAVSSAMLKRYRKHALVLIMVVSAIITPPDVFTMCLVTLPLYLLFECSIRVVHRVEKQVEKEGDR